MCFVKFHHKGSLSKHHARPLAKATVKQFAGKVHQGENDVSQLSVGTGEEEKGHSLLEGNCDELASATMFQEALRSWRNSGKKQEASSVAVESVSCGVQAASSDDAERKLLSSLESMSTNNPSSNASSYFETLLQTHSLVQLVHLCLTLILVVFNINPLTLFGLGPLGVENKQHYFNID
ncbi:PREDICTED: uncharacterized protein LOC109591974 isoform X2 [Amphimedon queenslandica]|nr:PREDICTED: uncharacterized protein LOC109591974 isoform X2 [Amphimedon queenslandica]|eukprot:XP_019863121.1 PREDICTED: uncharacterized protein LOC109591974 isoform X2 [Amphimedon queenslandica]